MHRIDLAPAQDSEPARFKNDSELVIDHAILRYSIGWIVANPSACVFVRNRAIRPVSLLKMHGWAPAFAKQDSAMTATSEDKICR
jgi:hypothetical protein